MFKKMMAKIGIGSAKVDLILKQNEYTLGDKVEGEVILQGGSVAQELNKIDVDFVLHLRTKQKEYRQVVSTISIPIMKTLRAGERQTIPFTYDLPKDLLVSSHMVAYYFATNLDIAAGVDSKDNDYIRVNPPARFMNILRAFEELGLREKHDSRAFDGYTQEFEFFPTSFLRDRVKEVEFVAAIEEHQIRLLLELDLYSFGREVEIKQEIVLSNELLSDVSRLADYLRDVMAEMAGNPEAYLYHRHSMPYGHGNHRHGGFAGAIGGLAAGLLGGMVISEIMNEIMEDEGVEEALGGAEEMIGEEEGEEDGGFFDDFFGGDDE
ncbi:sporulation protein [Aneurinibacillus danicus]|jgi:sporulation-control protein|uniref:Sporulation-control protein n=1 Tax=Aneurinibacillus danicus TaxID=267746 RepID=A0A511V200_9BACL|nr:sporulation protein [Aneurinibacillus danicus]GEN32936.1 hypothetical protein ADA01nite_03960 [Aneurinibacillus danicus]